MTNTPKTATVSDEAVQAACTAVFSQGYEPDAQALSKMRAALTAAYPHLALSPAEPAQGEQWQDIATAPKDGESILIWKPDERMVGEYLMSAYWCDNQVGFVPVGGHHKQGYYSDTAQCNQGYPTHWMPLPVAPLSSGRTTEGGEE